MYMSCVLFNVNEYLYNGVYLYMCILTIPELCFINFYFILLLKLFNSLNTQLIKL